jgi:2-keto-4-pentenoate hydratase/2-oxohepta-3-ene-1,7-dioic acid hydratase in catechol pathway
MIFSIPFLISYLSKIMTIFPGDVIITGTPPGVGPMEPGDAVTVEIENIGKLTNIVTLK